MFSVAMILIIVIGSLAVIGGLAHEWIWFKRRKWLVVEGTVTSNVTNMNADGTSHYPEIEYTHQGESRRFVSKYADHRARTVGSKIPVVVSPFDGTAEWYSSSHRFLFTLGPLFFGILFILLGLSTKPL